MTVEKKWGPKMESWGHWWWKEGIPVREAKKSQWCKEKKKEQACLHLHSALGVLCQWILTIIWSTSQLIDWFISFITPAHDMHQGLWWTIRSSYRNPGPVFYLHYNQSWPGFYLFVLLLLLLFGFGFGLFFLALERWATTDILHVE